MQAKTKRLLVDILLAGLLCLTASVLRAEDIASVRVGTTAEGAQFLVDGQSYMHTTVFLWPKGSKHTLQIQGTQALNGVQYVFNAWNSNAGQIDGGGLAVTVTADPAITWFQAQVGVNYALTLAFFHCNDDASCASSPGTVWVNHSQSFSQDAVVWAPAGSTVALQAVPNPGYVFGGWQLASGQGFAGSVVMNGPTVVQARFQVARTIRFATVPDALQIMADRSPTLAPASLEWGVDSTHTVGPVSPQRDRTGALWVFQSWSDGGAALHPYTVPQGSIPVTLTATYVPGVAVLLSTAPAGLKLLVDGRDNWLSYTFTWGVGETHRVEAPARLTDASGRAYVFRGWSNGGAAAQDLPVLADYVPNGLRLTAAYDPLAQISIQSDPAGLTLRVAGEDCTTPCALQHAVGEELRLSAPVSIPVAEGTRLDFAGWADGGGGDRTVTAAAASQTFRASYRRMNRLMALSDPSGGADWHMDPASPDGFYDNAAQVSVAVDARPGYRFRRWEGDLAGPFRSGTVAMTAPRSVKAVLDRIPYIAPAGVRNAAGDTGLDGVAPGSVIAIFGANLSASTETGPASPMVQALAGVTVRLGDRLLPLYFVSPGQINAQLPSDAAPGPQSVTVRSEGMPEVSAAFTVVRNAPGLFAVAAHEDGSAVSAGAPASTSETLTLYGTGFGPYDRVPPDGFALPPDAAYTLQDAVELWVGDAQAAVVSAGPAAGRPGLNAVRFQLPANLVAGSPQPVKVRINGIESNAVPLDIAQ